MTVLLGPTIALHAGVHASLEAAPPANISYLKREAVHQFLFPQPGGRPHRDAHWGEVVDFGPGAEVAHSARWPVLGRRGWVTDTDDLQVPLLCGRHMLSPDFREAYRDAPPDLRRHIRNRMENMLAAYGHASCQAVLFRSPHIARNATRWLSTLDLGRLEDAFLAKVRVMAPAQPPLEAEKVRHKWDQVCGGRSPLRVMFCGRDFYTKNGAMALRIFSRLQSEYPAAQFIYIGELAPEANVELNRTVHWSALSRADTLECMAACHILFHPSLFEGLGTVLLEAAAAGQAVIVARGGEMEHTSEIFGDDGALLLDRNTLAPADEEIAFESYLRRLLSNPLFARRLGEANRERTCAGEFSIPRRDGILGQVYAAAAHSTAPPLKLRDLPHATDAVTSLTSREVRLDELTYLRATGIKSGALVF